MRGLRIALIVVAVVCFGIALSYPIRYRMKQESNNASLDELAAMRRQAQTEAAETAEPEPVAEITQAPEIGLPIAEATQAPETGLPRAEEDDDAPLKALAELRRRAQTQTEATEAPEISLPQAEATEAPEISLPQTEATEAPEIGLPQAEATQAPEIGLPQAEATQAPEIGLPQAEATQAPEIGLPQAEATEAPEIGLPQAEATEAPEIGLPQAEATKAPEIDLPAAEATEETEAVSRTRADEAAGALTPTPTPAPTWAPGATPGFDELALSFDPHARPVRTPVPTVEPTPTPEPTPVPTYDGPLPYPLKEKVAFDESAILPELRDIYELNHDLIGWLTIPGTVIDYPVVQTEDSQYYLEHDFYGNSNMNGQIILDSNADPYTPSYNLVISGHHMQNGSMFGDLPEYRNKNYWEKRKFVEFDTLMARKQYVIFAVFYSADYDEDEEGFRYNADIQYRLDTRHWLEEIEENKLYDTGIDVAYGDEFITLTTCNRVLHKNGRFVVVCRRIREGETFE